MPLRICLSCGNEVKWDKYKDFCSESCARHWRNSKRKEHRQLIRAKDRLAAAVIREHTKVLKQYVKELCQRFD